MINKEGFTDAESELHEFWLKTWHDRFHCGAYTADEVADTMFHAAFAVWNSRRSDEDTARELYMLALNFASRAGIREDVALCKTPIAH
jgi:hypothetical protein